MKSLFGKQEIKVLNQNKRKVKNERSEYEFHQEKERAVFNEHFKRTDKNAVPESEEQKMGNFYEKFLYQLEMGKKKVERDMKLKKEEDLKR